MILSGRLHPRIHCTHIITTDDFNLLKIYVGKKEKYKKKHVPSDIELECSAAVVGKLACLALHWLPLFLRFLSFQREHRFKVDEDRSDYTVTETVLKSSIQ